MGGRALALRHHLPGVQRGADGDRRGMDLNGRNDPAHVAHIGRADERVALGVKRHEEIGERAIGGIHADGVIDGGDVLLGQRRADFCGEILVRLVEMRGTELLHDPVERFLKRSVGQDVGDGGNDPHLDLGFGHQRRALRALVDTLHQLVHAGQVAGANGIAHTGMGLHHIGSNAAGVEQSIVYAGVAGHVLAHVVHADIHQLHRVERAAAQMGRGSGMRGAPGEDEIRARVGERWCYRHLPKTVRVPGDGDVGVIQGA